jgi:hypothetical protein
VLLPQRPPIVAVHRFQCPTQLVRKPPFHEAQCLNPSALLVILIDARIFLCALPQSFSNLLWAYGTSGVEAPKLFAAAAEELIRRLCTGLRAGGGRHCPRRRMISFDCATMKARIRAFALQRTGLQGGKGVGVLRNLKVAVPYNPDVKITSSGILGVLSRPQR